MGSKKKLLIVTTVPETLATILKGQPRYLSNIFDVSLVTSPGKEVDKIRSAERVAIHPVPMFRGISPFKDLYSLVKMIFVLLRVRPDVIHSYTPKAGLIAMLAARVCFISVRIHTFTGLIFPTQVGFKQRLLIAIDRFICCCSTKVVPEGEGVKRDLIEFKVTDRPLKVIGYGNIAGVDTEHFSIDIKERYSFRQELSIPEDGFVFCFVGRLNKDKGISELAAAFSQLPHRAYLLLVGALDSSAPIDINVLEELRRNDRAYLLGFQEDIRPFLCVSDVLVLPSYREGFPNVILQAGAMRLPVIATNINGCNEAIKPDCNGWLVPSRDVQALQEAMQAAMDTPGSLMREMGDHARQRVIERFEQRDHWQRMVDFYKEELRA